MSEHRTTGAPRGWLPVPGQATDARDGRGRDEDLLDAWGTVDER
ncbi:hypothetical protein [Cellulomonas sp. URHB0016]